MRVLVIGSLLFSLCPAFAQTLHHTANHPIKPVKRIKRRAAATVRPMVTRPAGNFLSSYVGPHGGDLDVASSQVTFTGTDFLFAGTMHAPIGTTDGGFYVWGVDRGVGSDTADFSELGLPNIVFDIVVVAVPGGDSVVSDLDAGIDTPLPPQNVTVSGNNILVRVPASILNSKGFNPEQYTWNLWPRWGGVPFGDPQIATFAPDDHNAIVRSDRVMNTSTDFLGSYVGPHGGDLNVASSQVTFTGTDFVFEGTMRAPIGTTDKAFYVWGVDRGVGAETADFTELDRPDITFDLVVVAVPGGDSVINDLDAGIATPLPPENIVVNGNSILVRVPASMLDSKGFKPEQYMWNLWPRWGGVDFGDPQISGFAPNNRNAIVVSLDRGDDTTTNFLDSYVGPHGDDLSVASSQVTYTGTDFLFSGTMRAPIGTTNGAFYVWGVDRGVGSDTADFTELGLPDITFDIVVVAVPGGDSVVSDLDAGIDTPLPPENITVNGNNILVRVPASILNSKGLKPEQYMWNLWPRWGGVPFGDPQISQFAPLKRNAIVRSDWVSDTTGHFLDSYVGPKAGDLDVASSQVTFTGTDFIFEGTMKAPIGTTPAAFYVWGVDRGVGKDTADFSELGLPNIIFDLVVVAVPGGDSVVNDLDAGIATPLPPENIVVNGNSVLVRVPATMLNSKGFNPDQYMWNLWPRWGGVDFGDPQISLFAPGARNSIVNVSR